MASAMYEHGRERFGNGDVDWVNDTIQATLVNTSLYTVDLANDEYIVDVPSAAVIDTVTVTGKSNALGVFDADATTFPNVVDGAVVGALILWKNTDFDNSSPLLAYIDNAPELPATADGTDVIVSWDNGANKVLKL
jgi:hypothetical protein